MASPRRLAALGLAWGTALGLSACATCAGPVASDRLFIRLPSVQISPSPPAACPDGRKILSGWVRERMTDEASGSPSHLRSLPSPEEIWDSRGEDTRTIEQLNFTADERGKALINLLTAARSGNWCGGPK